MKSKFDILVVGGGIVGNAAALSLCRSGFEVGLLTPEPASVAPGNQPGLRVCSINPASSNCLHKLGCWESILGVRATPFNSIIARDASGSGEIQFNASECGLPYLGHIVENQVLTYCLEQALTTQENFVRLPASSLRSIDDDRSTAIRIQ